MFHNSVDVCSIILSKEDFNDELSSYLYYASALFYGGNIELKDLCAEVKVDGKPVGIYKSVEGKFVSVGEETDISKLPKPDLNYIVARMTSSIRSLLTATKSPSVSTLISMAPQDDADPNEL